MNASDTTRLVLNSEARPALDFTLTKKATTRTNAIAIKIDEANANVLPFVLVRLHTANGIIEKRDDSKGYITAIANSRKTEVALELCADRFSTFELLNNKDNYFELKFEPWIAEVFLKTSVCKRSLRGCRGSILCCKVQLCTKRLKTKSHKLKVMTTNMSGSGEYFTQPALAMSFVPVTEVNRRSLISKEHQAKWKGIPQEEIELVITRSLSCTGANENGVEITMKESLLAMHDDREIDDLMYTRLLSAGSRMDGDDTLMSSEERLLIISKKSYYATPHPGEAVYH